MIKAVIYDLDDTLINTSDVLSNALTATFELNKQDVVCTKTDFLNANKQAIIELVYQLKHGKLQLHQLGYLVWYKTLENLGKDLSPKLIFNLYDTLQKQVLLTIKLLPNVMNTFEWLIARNIRIGILSNGSFLERNRKLQTTNLLDKIDILVSSDLLSKDKPASEPFEYMITQLKTRPEETMMVGDSLEEDILPSIGSKLVGVFYNPKTVTVHESMLQIQDHFELTKLIERGFKC